MIERNGYRISERLASAPSRLQEMVDAGQPPMATIKGARFVPGYDPFLARFPGDPEAKFSTEREQAEAAIRKGSIKMTGNEYMDWQEKLKQNRKIDKKKLLKKAVEKAQKAIACENSISLSTSATV
jgi:hypothetical protein